MLITNASETKLDKEALSMARASLERNLHMAVKTQHGQVPWHLIVTNVELIEQVLYSI